MSILVQIPLRNIRILLPFKMVPSPLDMSTNKISDDIKLGLAFNRCTNSNRNCVTELPTGSAKCSNVQVVHFLLLYLLTIPFQCLPASKTIKTPDQDSGRLCGNATEMFIISTACSVVEYRKTHSRTTLSFLASLDCPPVPSPPSLRSVFLPGSETDHSGFSPSVTEKASLFAMRSGCEQKHEGTWHISSTIAGFREAFCMQARD